MFSFAVISHTEDQIEVRSMTDNKTERKECTLENGVGDDISGLI